jgi:hypothetical protein
MTTASKPRPRTQARVRRRTDIARSTLVSAWDWRAANPQLFPSDAALNWHLRRHRDAYVAAGALLKICDRWFCDPPRFEAILREIGQRTAAGTAADSTATKVGRRDIAAP